MREIPTFEQVKKTPNQKRLEKIHESHPVFNQTKYKKEIQELDEDTINKSILASLDTEALENIFDCLQENDVEKFTEIIKNNFPIDFSPEELFETASRFKEERKIEQKAYFPFLINDIIDETEVPDELKNNIIKKNLIKAQKEILHLEDYEYLLDIVLDVYDENKFRLRYLQHVLDRTTEIKKKYTKKYKDQGKKEREIENFNKFEINCLFDRAISHYDISFCKDEEALFEDLKNKANNTEQDKKYRSFFQDLLNHYSEKSQRVREIDESLKDKFIYDNNFKNLKKVQLLGVDFLVNGKNGDGHKDILADGMGLGKTITTIAATLYLGSKNNLIVAPNSLPENWKRELAKTTVPPENIAIINSPEDINEFNREESKHNPNHPTFTIVNNEKLSLSQFYEPLIEKTNSEEEEQTLIADEAHNFKGCSLKSKMSNSLLSLNTSNKSLLTGTPIFNNGVDLYNYFHLMDPEKYPITGNAKKEFIKDTQTTKGIHKIYLELRKYMLRRKLEDYDDNIKEIKENSEEFNIKVELGGVARKMYVAIIESFRKKYKDEKGNLQPKVYSRTFNLLKKLETNPHLVVDEDEINDDDDEEEKKEKNNIFNYLTEEETTKLFGELTHEEIREQVYKDEAPSKISLVLEKIKELGEGEKAVIFASSPKTVKRIYDELEKQGIKSTFISGENSNKKERSERVETFNNPNSDTNVLVMNQVGEEGINLQSAKYLFKLDGSLTSAQNEQINGRLIRTGQKNNVQIYNYTTKMPEEISETTKNKIRTIDSYITEVLIPRKAEITEFLLEGLVTTKELEQLREINGAEKNILLKLAA